MSPTMQQAHSVLSPASPEAHAISGLWWFMLAVGAAIWIAVTGWALYVSRTRERDVDAAGISHLSDRDERLVFRVVAGATALTVAILVTFLVMDFTVAKKLATSPSATVTINVVGHQWWWEYTYDDPDPSKQVVTANELHVPVGTQVRFALKAGDVIHSFWLPSMNGKRDMIPGHDNALQFQADTAGLYRGQCAEFCGLQHAKMAFYVVAEPKEQFNSWLEHQRQPSTAADSATTMTGRELFRSRSCATCHTIRGTDAAGHVAPDLTHFASRLTLAAGAEPNTAQNLSTWITSPDSIKPGTQMPSTPLSKREVRELVAYLLTLR